MVWQSIFDTFTYPSGSEMVAEAPEFITEIDCENIIRYFDYQNTSCKLHDHKHHTPNNEPVADFFSWDPECLDLEGKPTDGHDIEDSNNIFGISLILNRMKDAVERYKGQKMVLAKVVFHKYTPGAVGPEHTDVWPVASLLYFNDNYIGGSLYFPKQGIEISPNKKSLYIFDGGGDNMHGVKKIMGGYRYVMVAFWEYEDKENLQEFWYLENKAVDDENAKIEKIRQRFKSYAPTADAIYAHKFPILEIKQFIHPKEAKLIEDFLSKNDSKDECWGPVCFREYWDALGNNPDIRPVPVEHVDENYLSDINEKIKDAVKFYLERENIEFSKFKGHNHTTASSSPPHGHPPALAVGILALNDGYFGGELYIPKYDISFKLEPYSLYVFREGLEVPHGVSVVEGGERHTLVSHWQPTGHSYDLAGAPIRKKYVV